MAADKSEIRYTNYNLFSVINWETGVTSHVISNLNSPQSRICSMKFLNDEDSSILLTAASNIITLL